jgi:predicted nuclease of predicted toxin-antitoxin system
MRLLADENLERELVELMRALGHDVVWGHDAHRSWKDEDVLRLALGERRILVTADKDFGELVYSRKQATAGVVLLRLETDDIATNAAILERALPQIEQAGYGHFVVVLDEAVRIRPIEITRPQQWPE